MVIKIDQTDKTDQKQIKQMKQTKQIKQIKTSGQSAAYYWDAVLFHTSHRVQEYKWASLRMSITLDANRV